MLDQQVTIGRRATRLSGGVPKTGPTTQFCEKVADPSTVQHRGRGSERFDARKPRKVARSRTLCVTGRGLPLQIRRSIGSVFDPVDPVGRTREPFKG
jgi:hypothetical protein